MSEKQIDLQPYLDLLDFINSITNGLDLLDDEELKDLAQEISKKFKVKKI